MLEAQPDRNGWLFFLCCTYTRGWLYPISSVYSGHTYIESALLCGFRPGLGGDAIATEGIDRLPVVHLVIW